MNFDQMKELFKEAARPGFFMLIKCSWCGKSMGIRECTAKEHGQVSHGICPDCCEKQERELDAR